VRRGGNLYDTQLSNQTVGVQRRTGPSTDVAVTVSFSDVWNNTTNLSGTITQGTGSAANFTSNPLYVSATNLRLTANSPARFSGQDGGDLGALAFAGDPTPALEA